MSKEIILEGCIDSIEAINKFHDKGVTHLEVCGDLTLGGITPPVEFVELANKLGMHSTIMLRQRNDFKLLDGDLEAFKSFLKSVKVLDNAYFIFGFVKDGQLDKKAMSKVIKLLDGKKYGCHMAIDNTNNYEKAIEDAIELGCSFVLTSGGINKTAINNTKILKEVIDKYGDQIDFRIGGSVTADNYKTIAKETGAKFFHGTRIA